MQTAVPSQAVARAPTELQTPAKDAQRERRARIAGLICLCAIPIASFLLAASAASGPSSYVRVRDGTWLGWIAGPYEGIGLPLTSASFEAYSLVLLAAYLGVLATASRLPIRALSACIGLSYLLMMLGPPLLSQDIFGYLSFSRLGVLHGLDPYTHVAAEAPADPSFAYIGWPFQHTPYGPLFTLLGYGVAPLGLAAGLWAFKAIAVVCSLGAVALIARAARAEGRSGRLAAAFIALNPVMIESAVGGAHNDTITLLLISVALALSAGALGARAAASPSRGPSEAGGAVRRLRAATAPLAVAAGFKITGGLLMPFLILAPRHARERLRLLGDSIAGLIVVALIGAAGFGFGMAEFFVPLAEEQQQVSPLSIPAELGKAIGLGAPQWWRAIFLALFVCVLLYSLWRTSRGADWRVAAGWSTCALVFSTAWLLPWYTVWALPLAAVTNDRRLRIAVLVLCLYGFAMRLPATEALLG
ncbi:MAG: glycosyltransferase family 87 protein [Solirubrobacteraceae bacterium]